MPNWRVTLCFTDGTHTANVKAETETAAKQLALTDARALKPTKTFFGRLLSQSAVRGDADARTDQRNPEGADDAAAGADSACGQ